MGVQSSHFRRITALSGSMSLPPPRVFAGMSLLAYEQPPRKNSEKVGKTGPAAWPGEGMGRERPGILEFQAGLEKGRMLRVVT